MTPIASPAFEERMKRLEADVSTPIAGLYGPDSAFWPICRESLVFAGAWRAALLQLAHPWVAAAIDQHSTTIEDPVGRFHRTFSAVWTMVFGDWKRVDRAARNLYALHTSIRGTVSEASPQFATGSTYEANTEEALIWVHATLWDTTITVRELLFGPLPQSEKEAFYQETKKFATLFGIHPDQLPSDWKAFMDYNHMMWTGDVLHVGETARNLGEALFKVKQLPFSRWWMPTARTCTAEIFPEPLREAFGLPPATAATARTLRRTVRGLRCLHPVLPKKLRYLPPWHEAQQRLQGKTKADPVTRKLCKMWIGRSELVIGP